MTSSTAPNSTEFERLRELLSQEHQSRLETETLAEGLRHSLQEAQKEAHLIQEIALAANEQSSPENALHFALVRVCAYTGWMAGRLYFCRDGEASKTPVPAAVWHVSEPALEDRLGLLFAQTSLLLKSELPKRVLASGEPAWISNIAQVEDCAGTAAVRECGVQSVLAFPVLAGKDIAAVLEFFSREPVEPDAPLLRVMRLLGIQLGRVLERRRYQDKLFYDAFHDPLTQLPNRALFLERLTQCAARALRHPDHMFAVLTLNIDCFRIVNDSLGDDSGDRLIVAIAERLRRSVRSEDMVARPANDGTPPRQEDGHLLAQMHGDEFAILLEDLRDSSDSLRVAERTQRILTPPFRINGQEVFITASIGIAISTSGYSAAEDLLRSARTALHRAKARGKARYEIFDAAMHASSAARMELEAELHRAVLREQFRVHYQPIFSLQDGRATGFEALVRWQRPGAGLLLPAEFLAVAEETGLLVLIGKWVLREACRQMRAWNLQFPSTYSLTMAVNLSAREFSQRDLAAQVRGILHETSLVPRALKLEITESVLMADAEKTCGVFAELKALGISLSIDDFGTGYSSLGYLRRFPLDTLKIDRSFISTVEHDKASRQIVEMIVNLGRTLGMEVVAEGLETAGQVDYLKTLGCDYAQGYFFSPPLDAGAAVQKALAHLPAA
ncbi:MAG: EAL domain-containing protein [Acidobacteriia bacterium]|nr:EAL domain-containing protein [Terriglobia bacterium]